MTKMLRMTESALTAHNARVSKPRVSEAEFAAARAGVAFVKPKKERKYKNRFVYFDRIIFQSEAECERYKELRLLERGGLIQNLVVHPVFPLHVDGQRIANYTADFSYDDKYVSDAVFTGWRNVTEDVKSKVTAQHRSFLRTCKHVLAEYGVRITVVLR